MKEFTIPKSFELFARKIDVRFRDDLMEESECIGRAIYQKSLIELQSSIKGAKSRDKGDITDTFFHELVHFILYAMADRELQGSEEFVSVFGRLLHQVFTSMEY